MSQSWTYDEIIFQLKITWGNYRVKMRAGWKWYDAGMEPVTVVIYDITHTSHRTGEDRVERRILTVQGKRQISDYILDYMEGW